MKKLTTATIATFGLVTLGVAAQDAQAAEQNPTSAYTTSYSEATHDYITIDENGNKHHTLDGNWNPSMQYVYYTYDANGTYDYYYYSNEAVDYSYATAYNTVATPVVRDNTNYTEYTGQTTTYTNAATPQYASYNTQASVQAPTASTTNYNYTTTTTAPAASTSVPTTAQTSAPVRFTSTGGANLYTVGQCTYYVYDRVGGGIGNTWGNASNWASAARAAGYTVNNTPRAGAIMQTSVGPYGHVAYVESVGANGSVTVSEMNYGHGAGVVTSRTLSASQAATQNFIYR
ncbi:CHAP domain-containing protein [Staphylococcus chromogenes]|uniref:CHAP domain-containing protein n=1 Tax=Staphylococcus chromogenes TaxID=46126 RepID=UPI002884A4C9|nr:CHAP domain-containing protein [Staphylococcus chromogenes]MDT0748185.1 CHAP domain-containing protein [Staphylococcus chromogenes]